MLVSISPNFSSISLDIFHFHRLGDLVCVCMCVCLVVCTGMKLENFGFWPPNMADVFIRLYEKIIKMATNAFYAREKKELSQPDSGLLYSFLFRVLFFYNVLFACVWASLCSGPCHVIITMTLCDDISIAWYQQLVRYDLDWLCLSLIRKFILYGNSDKIWYPFIIFHSKAILPHFCDQRSANQIRFSLLLRTAFFMLLFIWSFFLLLLRFHRWQE